MSPRATGANQSAFGTPVPPNGSVGEVLQKSAADSWALEWSSPSTFPIGSETSSPVTVDDTHHTILCDCTSNAITVDLPAVSAVNAGRVYNIKKIDATANAVTIDGNGSETIDGATTALISSQYESITVQSDGSNWHIL